MINEETVMFYFQRFCDLISIMPMVGFGLKDIPVWSFSQNFVHCFSRPTQCNQNRSVCWCVNDNGEVLPGTKQPTNQDTRHHCGKCHALYLSFLAIFHYHPNSWWHIPLQQIISLFFEAKNHCKDYSVFIYFKYFKYSMLFCIRNCQLSWWA